MPVYFGAKIKAARRALGLTQQQLAQQLGVKNTTISNWEKDLNRPSPDMIEQLCGVLGLAPSALFGEKEAFADQAGALGLDDFTYALHNEARQLTPENKEKLLEMARFFKQQQEREKR